MVCFCWFFLVLVLFVTFLDVFSRKATEVDAKYVKAWVRLGVSEFELGNYEAAHDAYNQALRLTPSTDKNWEQYMERIQLCEQKMNTENSANANDSGNSGGMPQGMPDMSQLGNLFGNMGANGGGGGGGQPNLQDMFNNMGGMDGLSKLMQNPMMQQMANQFMQDPNMMSNLQNMMSNPNAQEAMKNMMGGGNDADAKDVQDSLAKLLQDPEKAQEAMKKAMEDEEMKELMKDPEVASIANRIKTGDYTALMELSFFDDFFFFQTGDCL